MLTLLPSELRLKIYPYLIPDLTLSISWCNWCWQCSHCGHAHPISCVIVLNADCEDAYRQSKCLLLLSRTLRLEILPLVRASFKTLCIPRASENAVHPCVGVYHFIYAMPTLQANLTTLRVENGLQLHPPLILFPNLDTITIHVGFVANITAECLPEDEQCAKNTMYYMMVLPGEIELNKIYKWALLMRRERHLNKHPVIKITVVGALLSLPSRRYHVEAYSRALTDLEGKMQRYKVSSSQS